LAAILKMAAENQFPIAKDFCNVDQTFLNQNIQLLVNDFKYATFDLLRHSNPPFLKMAAAKTNVPYLMNNVTWSVNVVVTGYVCEQPMSVI